VGDNAQTLPFAAGWYNGGGRGGSDQASYFDLKSLAIVRSWMLLVPS